MIGLIDIIWLFLAVAIWGINFVVIKIAVTDAPPITLMFLRAAITSIILLPCALNLRLCQEWRKIFTLSLVFGTITNLLLFVGFKIVPSTEAIILSQMQVPLSGLLAYFVHQERISKLTFSGIFISFMGMLISIGVPDKLGDLYGIIILLTAAAFWSISNNIMKQVKSISSLTLNSAISLFSLPQLFILSIIFEPNTLTSISHWLTWKIVMALLFMVLASTIIAYSIWFKMLKKYPVSIITPFNLFVPVIGITASCFILHQSVSLHVISGAIICLIGLMLVITGRNSINLLSIAMERFKHYLSLLSQT